MTNTEEMEALTDLEAMDEALEVLGEERKALWTAINKMFIIAEGAKNVIEAWFEYRPHTTKEILFLLEEVRHTHKVIARIGQDFYDLARRKGWGKQV